MLLHALLHHQALAQYLAADDRHGRGDAQGHAHFEQSETTLAGLHG
uniref:Transcriptional regulator n=1 Tax=Steinernema glaseri TaxID=37863 RepID=A0A1I7YB67_9BILA